MTGPIRDTTGERTHDSFVESPTRANKTAVEVVFAGAGSATLTNQTVAHTISLAQINTWQSVPTIGLLNIFQVDVYDATNTFPINIAYRISGSNNLEILSQSAQTYTLRIIGAS
jgi:hypothetical protein